MREHLQRLSGYSRLVAGGAAFFAVCEVVCLGLILFSHPKPVAKGVVNPFDENTAALGHVIDTVIAIVCLVVLAAGAAVDWLATAWLKGARHYRLLVGVAVFNLALSIFTLNLGLLSILAVLLTLPFALYLTVALIADDVKQLFRAVETGKSFEEAWAGKALLVGRNTPFDRTAALAELEQIAAPKAAAPSSALKPAGGRPGPAGSGTRPTASGTRPTGSGTGPTASGTRPMASGARPIGNSAGAKKPAPGSSKPTGRGGTGSKPH
ncbi:MAG: hypothetical protein ACREJ2_04030 [Planctomycetota bacterium]